MERADSGTPCRTEVGHSLDSRGLRFNYTDTEWDVQSSILTVQTVSD